MIRFEYQIKQLDLPKWDGAQIVKMDGEWSDLTILGESVMRFNSEIHWDEMWDIGDAIIRLNAGHIAFALIYEGKAIGHVWYDRNTLYNAYVSRTRPDGLSAWFIQNTIRVIAETGYKSIRINVDGDNLRAIKFWKKIGFTEIF